MGPGIIPYTSLIGGIIQHRRKAAGIHQEVMAKTLNLSQSAYSRIETGDTAASVTQLRRIAEQLGTTAAEILSSADHLATQLAARGVQMTDEKPNQSAAIVLGIGILTALIIAIGSSQ